MHKPVIFNRYLGRKWKEKENHLLANKLTLVKSQVDTKCPVSYVNYKTKLKRENPMTNLLREFEIKRDNQMLVNKIYRIFTQKSPTKDKEKRHVEKITKMRKTTSNTEQQKWRIFQITQENQSMLKRLQDTQSCYDHKIYARDYNKAQTYKKNICEYPSHDPISDRTHYSKGFYPIHSKYKLNPISLNSTGYPKTSSNWSNNRYEDNNLNEKQKILFSKKILFQDLFQCYVKFYLESKKFIISLSTISEDSKTYFIIFESSNDIVLLEEVYKSYEQIINDLDHSVNLNLLVISNNQLNVNYITIFKDSPENINIEEVLSRYRSGSLPGKNILSERTLIDNKYENNDKISIQDEIVDENPNDDQKKQEFENEINSDDKEQVQLNQLISDSGEEKEDIEINEELKNSKIGL